MAIYEMHLGSWRRVAQDGNRSLSYRELAPQLAEYLRQLGYTHVEFMPVHGASVLRLLGLSDDRLLRADQPLRHAAGPHVPDRLPAPARHRRDPRLGARRTFPATSTAWATSTARTCTSTPIRARAMHPDWDSCIFNYGRNEVRNFLHPNALFWLDKYHIDGLRVDAVASMLYLDYARKAGRVDSEPVRRPRKPRGHRFPAPIQRGGLSQLSRRADHRRRIHRLADGFAARPTSAAWASASSGTWAGCTTRCEYMRNDPIHRKYHHDELTFRMLYAFNENFVLPLSHDEVVHGKGSLLTRCRAMTGRSSPTCGCSTATCTRSRARSCCSWAANSASGRNGTTTSLDWHLLQYRRTIGDCSSWLGDLNRLYRGEPALHELDCDPRRFRMDRLRRRRQQHRHFAAQRQIDLDAGSRGVQFYPGATRRLRPRRAARRLLARSLEQRRTRIWR